MARIGAPLFVTVATPAVVPTAVPVEKEQSVPAPAVPKKVTVPS